MLGTTVCRTETFLEPWFGEWARSLGIDDPSRPLPLRNLHRKVWEWVCIAQALGERDLLRSDKIGLGFAVGNEKLPSLFASLGAKILATDTGDQQTASDWKRTNEYGGSLASLHHPQLVTKEEFERLVTYRHADMRDLSAFHDQQFDFLWSACALEHLGTLEAGMEFIIESTRLLKQGGVGVHTTEFNVSSLDDTVSKGNTVLYRKCDIEKLDGQLRAIGAGLAPMDLFPGTHQYDLKFDIPPFYEGDRKHLKLRIGNFVCTSIILVVQN
jgi:hypothetical protein